MNLIYRSQAEAELAEALEYYLLEARARTADRFADAIDEGLAAIKRGPFILREIEKGVRAKFLKRFPYSIIYEVIGEEIIIFAFMHQSRKPGYWHDRR